MDSQRVLNTLVLKKKKKKRKENKLLQSFWRFPGKGILSIQTSIEMIYSKVQTLTLITLTIVLIFFFFFDKPTLVKLKIPILPLTYIN